MNGRFLDFGTRLDIAIDVAHAVTYLHMYSDHPIIHRDIKSSNILLDADFEPKVADFGIAKVLQGRGGGGADREASTTTIAGTYGYLAPGRKDPSEYMHACMDDFFSLFF